MFTAAELSELRAGLARFGVFFAMPQIDTRWWAGVGHIRPGVNLVDDAGQTYKGAGELIEFDDLLSLFDGTASRISLTVAQIPVSAFAEVAEQVAEQQVAIQGKEIHIGWVAMDVRWRLLGSIHWEWSGFADGITLNHRASTTADGPAMWSLSLSCGDWLTGLRRPGLSFMADNDQRARAAILNPSLNPDRFCERVGRYSVGTEKPLPIED